MAELNGDLPQVQTQGSVGGISPNVEAITATGRGIEAAGHAISEGGSFLYRKASQNEVANVYADIAAAREKYTENLNNAQATGELDTEQFAQQMKDETDKIGEGLSTTEGRNFFERQQARLTGAMLLKASHVSGQIAYNNTIDSLTQAGNSLSNSAMRDPSQFGDIIDQNEEMISASVSNGQLPAGKAEAFRKEMNTKIADGAAKGLAQMDPGKNPDGSAKENLLIGALKRMDPNDTKDNSNLFKYLNADQVSNLQAYARHMDEARRVQEDQVDSNQEKLLRLKGQVWLNQNSANILGGHMDPKTVINNPNLTIEQKNMAVEMIRRQSREVEERDPGYINNIEDQIINGKITSRDQLTAAYNSNPSGMGHAYWDLAKRIDETPDGHVVKENVKQLFQMGDQELKFKGVGGSYTAEGDNRNYAFRQEVQAAANLYVQSGKGSLRDFYSNHNAKDPDSPLAILNKYRLSATQKAQLGAQEALMQMSDPTGRQNSMIKLSTSPSGDIPQPTQPPTARTEDMIKPGESIVDWKKRTKRQ